MIIRIITNRLFRVFNWSFDMATSPAKRKPHCNWQWFSLKLIYYILEKVWLLEMYICNCNGVREKEIQQVIHQGLKTWEQILAYFSYVPCCGLCEEEINVMIKDHSLITNTSSMEKTNNWEIPCAIPLPKSAASTAWINKIITLLFFLYPNKLPTQLKLSILVFLSCDEEIIFWRSIAQR